MFHQNKPDKAMFTTKFIVNPRDNALRLRITNNRKKTEMSIGVQITQADLENALSAKPIPRNIKWKSLLSHYQSKIDEIKCDLLKSGRANENVKTIKGLIYNALFGDVPGLQLNGVGSFAALFQEFTESKQNERTKELYKETFKKMEKFDPALKEKGFEDINLKWLADFEDFCALTSCKNARNIHLRNIRAVFNYAIDNEAASTYPFRRFKIRPEATRKRSLPVEGLRKLFDYPVEPYAEVYRDMFKLIFMLIGINTVDLYGLKSITRDCRVEYKRAKTGRLYSIKVEPEAMEIIGKYKGQNGLLCIADRWSDSRNFCHQMNNALQKTGTVKRKGRGGKKFIEPEFEGVTSYWARHSWATIAASLDIPKDTIAHALGHGGNTVTDIYIDFDQRKVDEANRRVLDWVLYCKR